MFIPVQSPPQKRGRSSVAHQRQLGIEPGQNQKPRFHSRCFRGILALQFRGVPSFGNVDVFLEYPCDGPASSEVEPVMPIAPVPNEEKGHQGS